MTPAFVELAAAKRQPTEGDLRAAREWFEEAHRAAERAGDAEAMAHAVLGLSGLWVQEQRGAAGTALLQARLQRALSSVGPESTLALRLRARLAAESDYGAGTHTAVLAVVEQARARGDPLALAEALSLAHHCVLGPEHGALREALATELIGQSESTGRRGDLLMGLLWKTVDLFLAGNPHAERHLAELREQLAREEHPAVSFVVAAIGVMLAIRAGHLDDAEALAEVCAQCGTAAGDADAAGWYGAHLVTIRWYQGRLPELLPAVQNLAHSPNLSQVDNSWFAAMAVAAASAGDHRSASGALARLCGDDLDTLPRSSTWLVALHGAVEAAALVGDTDTATHAYQLLRPYAHLPVMASLAVACFGSVHHALGVAAMTAGDLDVAVEHLTEAVRRNLALAHWPATMASRIRLAEALTRRGGRLDTAEARSANAAAARDAAAMGITKPGDGPSGRAVCVREGQAWRIGYGQRSVLLRHCVGMSYLAVLLNNSGQELPAVELAAGPVASSGAVEDAWLSKQPKLDRAAIHQYRQRLSQLEDELDRIDPARAPDRAAKVTAERDWLLAELRAAAGIGDRARQFPDSPERARVAVTKAIRRALNRVDQADPLIGGHLRDAVHTGVRCSYRPD